MVKFLRVMVPCVFLAVALFGGAKAVTLQEDLSTTPEQRRILEMFRERVSPKLYMDYMKEDLYLLRWLKVKEFNIKEAERSLDENLRWRRENKMDTVHQEDWSDMKRDYPYTIDGFDKEGRPVGTVSIRNWDIRKAVMQGKLQRLQRYMDKMMDEISLKVLDLRKQGKDVSRWTLLTNTAGFNIITHACAQCTDLWVNFLKSYENHFPNSANEIIAINSPETFNLVLSLIKPSIPKTSKEAIRILNSNKGEWMRVLDSKIDRDQRTQEYGGLR